MAIVVSVCIAVLITLAIFPREFKKSDLTPIIFLLGVVAVATLCSFNPAPSMSFSKGPNMLLMAGVGVLILITASSTNTFKILTNLPASAYKSLVPVAICVGVLLLLGLTVIL